MLFSSLIWLPPRRPGKRELGLDFFGRNRTGWKRPLNAHTIKTVNITFDHEKDMLNRSKHGISLAEAAKLDWDDALVLQDERREYGEARLVALAPMAERLWVVVFTDRPEGRRVISLRKANLREYRRYEQAS